MSASTYVVIDVVLIINDMIIESVNEETTFRKSLDGTEAILKFNVKYPNTMVGYTKLDWAEMVQYLIDNTALWNKVGDW